MELRRRHQEVVVIDARCPPIDKACGEGIMPEGLEILRSLGVEIASDKAARFRGIRYVDGEEIAEARFPGAAHGLGVRRTILHAAMVDRAISMGVRCHWGQRVEGLVDKGIRTHEGLVQADWIVGADGLRSAVRDWAGLRRSSRRFERYGVRRHFALQPWSDLVEVYWAEGCEAYVTPVSGTEVGVALLWSGEKGGFNRLIQRFPSLSARLEGSQVTSRDRGLGPLEQRCRRVVHGRVALVGDAAGYRDAITGEGISLALLQASALARAIEMQDLSTYERQARRLNTLPFAFIRMLLEVEARPRLRRRFIAALNREPSLFAQLLAVHTRQEPVRQVGISVLARLIRGLLIA